MSESKLSYTIRPAALDELYQRAGKRVTEEYETYQKLLAITTL
ncbi:MAG: hypothetical protein ABI901_14985 [Roseiflexaceae bacterium]